MAEVRRYLDNEFAKKRDLALREARARRDELYSKIPVLAQIDEEITLTGIRHARAVLSGNASDSDAQALSNRINDLNNRKKALLEANNLPADYLEPKFSCPVCEDRGYILQGSGESIPCSCYQRLYLERLYETSNILDDGNTGFDRFEESYYSETPDRKKYGAEISPREQIRNIKAVCLEFIENFAERDNPDLYFFGGTGTGKTFIAKSTGLELMKRGYTVLYLSATSLFSIIHQYRISTEKYGDSGEEAYKSLITANLLILDDLGTEPASDARFAELLSLLELRKNQSRTRVSRTIIASNFDLKRLSQEYNERIASRILGEFKTLKFIGDDIRILKKVGLS